MAGRPVPRVPSDRVVPRYFPYYKPDPKLSTYWHHCWYRLLQWKPWHLHRESIWGGLPKQKPTAEQKQMCIDMWAEYRNSPAVPPHQGYST